MPISPADPHLPGNSPTPTAYRSKTLAAWLALVLGAFGVHRWYLRGLRDPWAWLFLVPTLAGLAGVMRMRNIAMDDTWGWVLAPLFGLSLSAAMLSAIVFALTPDERWDMRHNPQAPRGPNAGWAAVVAAVVGLLLGGAAFMSTVAFTGQMFFEWERARDQPPIPAADAIKSGRD